MSSEPFDRAVASAIRVPALAAQAGPGTGVPMVHEGGSATHNGHATMIVAESVVMQRNLGPNRFCGGRAPVTDYAEWNTYAPNPDWPACRALVEAEYRRMLGVQKPGRSSESRRRDQKAQEVLHQLFPEREIVAIHSENINRGGGGMNCITQQQPASTTSAGARPERD
jgi:Porphyromonas-type peptidyl-arginine deiminase